jgi:AraC family transcriptional regulator of arabinose operon
MKRSLLAVSKKGVSPSECFSRLIATAFLMNRVPCKEMQQVIDNLSITLFSEYLHLSMNTSRVVPDEMIPKVLSYIEDHLAEERCLPEAKRISGYSESAFMYKFKAATGHTPSRYLWQLRTEKGIQLLSETGLSISEIAYRCGFKTPFHFSRSVRQLQGLPPRALRQSAWQGSLRE